MNIVEVFIGVIGVLLILAGTFGWLWLADISNRRWMVDTLGIKATRIFYLVTGLLITSIVTSRLISFNSDLPLWVLFLLAITIFGCIVNVLFWLRRESLWSLLMDEHSDKPKDLR